MYVDVLPRWERYTYGICGISSIAYSVFTVFQEGEKNKAKYEEYEGLVPGWSWIGRPKDHGDYGWQADKIIIRTAIPWVVIHIMLSQTCWYFQLNARMRSLLLTMADVCLLCLVFGTTSVIFLLVMATIMYMVVLQGRLRLMWLVALSMLCAWVFIKEYYFQMLDLLFQDSVLSFQFHLSSTLVWIKVVSFGLQKSKFKEYQTSTKKKDSDNSGKPSVSSDTSSSRSTQSWRRKSNNEISAFIPASQHAQMDIVESDPSYLDFMFYLFYYPTFFCGPFYEYGNFHNQVKASFKSFIITENVFDIIMKLIKIAFFITILEFNIHFLYYAQLGLDNVLLEDVSAWTLIGILYCQCCYFTAKYCIIYGLGIQLSRFDGIAPLPTPQCINLSYSSIDVWTTWDVGTYTFLKKCIFIPLGGSKRGVLRQLLLSGLCFLFMIFWHGAESNIVIWGVGNYFTCVLETVACNLDKSCIGAKIKAYLSPAMILRLKALLYYPHYTMLQITHYYFFFGDDTGWIGFCRLTFQSSWLSHAGRCFFITCNIHTAIYLQQLYQHRRNKRHEE